MWERIDLLKGLSDRPFSSLMGEHDDGCRSVVLLGGDDLRPAPLEVPHGDWLHRQCGTRCELFSKTTEPPSRAYGSRLTTRFTPLLSDSSVGRLVTMG